MNAIPNASPIGLERLERYLALDPHNPLLLAQAIDAALAEGRVPRARELADAAIAALPGDAPLLQRHGHVLLAEGHWPQAIDVFRDLLARHTDPDIAADLALAQLQQGDPEEARATLEPFVEGGRASPAALTCYLRALHALGQNNAALAITDHWLAMCDTHGEFLAVASLVAADEDEDEIERAMLWSDAALRMGRWPEALLAAGTVALARQDAERAEQLFREAQALRPREPRAQAGVGLALLLRGDAAGARGPLSAAVESWPRHDDALLSLAWCEVMLNELDAAATHFERAAEVDAGLAAAHGGLAVVYALRRSDEPARAAIARAQQLDPEDLAASLAGRLLGGSRVHPSDLRALLPQSSGRNSTN